MRKGCYMPRGKYEEDFILRNNKWLTGWGKIVIPHFTPGTIHLADLRAAFPQPVFIGIPGIFYSFLSTSRCPASV